MFIYLFCIFVCLICFIVVVLVEFEIRNGSGQKQRFGAPQSHFSKGIIPFYIFILAACATIFSYKYNIHLNDILF